MAKMPILLKLIYSTQSLSKTSAALLLKTGKMIPEFIWIYSSLKQPK
jgi:hypothetical protein